MFTANPRHTIREFSKTRKKKERGGVIRNLKIQMVNKYGGCDQELDFPCFFYFEYLLTAIINTHQKL